MLERTDRRGEHGRGTAFAAQGLDADGGAEAFEDDGEGGDAGKHLIREAAAEKLQRIHGAMERRG